MYPTCVCRRLARRNSRDTGADALHARRLHPEGTF